MGQFVVARLLAAIAFAACLASTGALAFPMPLPSPNLAERDFRKGSDPVATSALGVVLGPNGNAFVVGPFTHVDGFSRPHGIARLNVDGTLDTAWSPTLPLTAPPAIVVEGASGAVVIGALEGGSYKGILVPAGSGSGSVFATWSSYPQAITLDSAGAIYVAILSNTTITVNRYAPSGTADPAFQLLLGGVFYPCFNPFWVNAPRLYELRVIDGFLYLGGDFTSLGNDRGAAGIKGAARVSAATGDVDSGWAPLASSAAFGAAEGEEKATCVVTHAGATSIKDGPNNTVYMAGLFRISSGHKYVARFSKNAPGAPDASWNPPPPQFGPGSVSTDPSGNFVYIAASTLGEIVGLNRSGFAAYLASSGELTPWDPGGSGSTVVALDDRVVLAGFFTSIHGAVRHRLAAVARPDAPNPGPRINLAPRLLDFGTVQLGVQVSRNLVVGNPGSGPLTIQNIEIQKSAGTTATVTHDCLPQVPAGGQCMIRLEASHSSGNDQVQAPRLVITSDGAGTPQNVNASWTLVAPILHMVDKEPIRGGWAMRAPVGYTRTETVTVRNGGTVAPMEITSVAATAGEITQSNTCTGATLAPGGACQMTVSFTPQQAGKSIGKITFTFAKPTAFTTNSWVSTYATSHEVEIALSGDNAGDDSDGDGMPNGMEPGEGLNPSVKDNDIFGSSRLFAMQQYRDFLAREGDAGGIAYWSQQLGSGATTRAQMAMAFLTSPEFADSIAPVARLYFAFFKRVPDYDGLNFWIAQYRTRTIESISDTFAASPEFAARYGAPDNGQFVALVYQNVLGREPDATGRDYWAARLASGAMTRGQLMVAFSESSEYRSLITPEVLVTMTYMGMLRRAPDPGGFSYWVNYVDQGNSLLALVTAFVNAPEYRKRFLP